MAPVKPNGTPALAAGGPELSIRACPRDLKAGLSEGTILAPDPYPYSPHRSIEACFSLTADAWARRLRVRIFARCNELPQGET
jgi:hypothetical protein